MGLETYSATGKDLATLAEKLHHESAIEQVIMWGNELRICGTDDQAIKAVIARYPMVEWKRVDSSMEEVFIHLFKEGAHDAR